MLATLPDAAIDVLARAERSPPKGCVGVIMVQRLGGKIDRLASGPDPGAYAHRGADFWVACNCITSKKGKPEDPDRAVKAVAWLEAIAKELEPHVITKDGVGCISAPMDGAPSTKSTMEPINTFGDDARVEKLRAIKLKYDPQNVFAAVNNGMSAAHNILPVRK